LFIKGKTLYLLRLKITEFYVMETKQKTDCDYCGKSFTYRKSKRFCSTTCRAKNSVMMKAPVSKESIALTLSHLRNLLEKSKNLTPDKEAEIKYAIESTIEIQSYEQFK
jgi:hypothetical protein